MFLLYANEYNHLGFEDFFNFLEENVRVSELLCSLHTNMQVLKLE